jgi:carbamoyl-phosphate synthase large subunit
MHELDAVSPVLGLHFAHVAHYKTLKAWQHAQRLAIECVRTSRAFPDYEQAGLADQLRRACYSVPLNIAEGNTRYGSRDCRRFLDTARGSLAEVETIIEMARELGYITPADFGRLEALVNETGRTLYGLLRRVSGAAGKLPIPRAS